MMKRQTRKCVLVSLVDSPAAVTLFSWPATRAEREACMINWTQNLDLYRTKTPRFIHYPRSSSGQKSEGSLNSISIESLELLAWTVRHDVRSTLTTLNCSSYCQRKYIKLITVHDHNTHTHTHPACEMCGLPGLYE